MKTMRLEADRVVLLDLTGDQPKETVVELENTEAQFRNASHFCFSTDKVAGPVVRLKPEQKHRGTTNSGMLGLVLFTEKFTPHHICKIGRVLLGKDVENISAPEIVGSFALETIHNDMDVVALTDTTFMVTEVVSGMSGTRNSLYKLTVIDLSCEICSVSTSVYQDSRPDVYDSACRMDEGVLKIDTGSTVLTYYSGTLRSTFDFMQWVQEQRDANSKAQEQGDRYDVEQTTRYPNGVMWDRRPSHHAFGTVPRMRSFLRE